MGCRNAAEDLVLNIRIQHGASPYTSLLSYAWLYVAGEYTINNGSIESGYFISFVPASSSSTWRISLRIFQVVRRAAIIPVRMIVLDHAKACIREKLDRIWTTRLAGRRIWQRLTPRRERTLILRLQLPLCRTLRPHSAVLLYCPVTPWNRRRRTVVRR